MSSIGGIKFDDKYVLGLDGCKTFFASWRNNRWDRLLRPRTVVLIVNFIGFFEWKLDIGVNDFSYVCRQSKRFTARRTEDGHVDE